MIPRVKLNTDVGDYHEPFRSLMNTADSRFKAWHYVGRDLEKKEGVNLEAIPNSNTRLN